MCTIGNHTASVLKISTALEEHCVPIGEQGIMPTCLINGSFSVGYPGHHYFAHALFTVMHEKRILGFFL